jgi:hypothetical protein
MRTGECTSALLSSSHSNKKSLSGRSCRYTHPQPRQNTLATSQKVITRFVAQLQARIPSIQTCIDFKRTGKLRGLTLASSPFRSSSSPSPLCHHHPQILASYGFSRTSHYQSECLYPSSLRPRRPEYLPYQPSSPPHAGLGVRPSS